MKFIDLTGRTYGLLTVRCVADRTSNPITWLCDCACGKKSVIRRGNLVSGNTKSCGCEENKFHTQHGHAGATGRESSPTYKSWQNMIVRVRRGDAGHEQSKWYKGVHITPAWFNFTNFLHDMGERPDGLTLDRIDGAKGYSKTNCRWATFTQQSRNTRTKTSISGHRGVVRSANKKRWVASLAVASKRISLGTFTNLDDAVAARKQGEIKYWGDEC
jgi:hypothetical protein